MQFDSRQLVAFAAVLREGSFDAAARALFITPSAVSQRIKALEDRLGSVLIQRGAPCTATLAGQALQRHTQQVLLLEAQALSAFGLVSELNAAPAPLPIALAIAVNADSLATWLVPALARVTMSHRVTFDLVVEDQDHSYALLREGKVMAAITSDATAVQGCSVEPLGAMRYAAVASPAFYATYFSRGVSARALAAAPCNRFNRRDALQAQFLQKLCRTPVTPHLHYLPNTHGFVEAALHGLGWGMNPLSLVENHLQSGALRELRPGLYQDVPLYWQCWRLESAVMQALSTAIREVASTQLRKTNKFIRHL